MELYNLKLNLFKKEQFRGYSENIWIMIYFNNLVKKEAKMTGKILVLQVGNKKITCDSHLLKNVMEYYGVSDKIQK